MRKTCEQAILSMIDDNIYATPNEIAHCIGEVYEPGWTIEHVKKTIRKLAKDKKLIMVEKICYRLSAKGVKLVSHSNM